MQIERLKLISAFVLAAVVACGDGASPISPDLAPVGPVANATMRIELLGFTGPVAPGGQPGSVGLRLCVADSCMGQPETIRQLSGTAITDLSLAAGTYVVRIIAAPGGHVEGGVFAGEALQIPVRAKETAVAFFVVTPESSQ